MIDYSLKDGLMTLIKDNMSHERAIDLLEKLTINELRKMTVDELCALEQISSIVLNGFAQTHPLVIKLKAIRNEIHDKETLN
jgi:hypothetical protein